MQISEMEQVWVQTREVLYAHDRNDLQLEKEMYVYLVTTSEVQRRIPITQVECATKSTCSNEFVIHVRKEYDYRFASERKDDIFRALKYAYH